VTAKSRSGLGLVRWAGSALWGMRRQARRRRLLVSVALRARWLHAEVDVRLSRDVELGRRVRVELDPHTSSVMWVGPVCRLGDDVSVHLRGGRLVMGRAIDLRAGCRLEVAGQLELIGPNLVQRLSSIHCDDAVTIGPYAVLSEMVTVVDSTHPHHGPSKWFLDDVVTSPVVVGPQVWVGAKATVARGVEIGPGAVVSANSLVVDDVAAGWLVSGVPAARVHPVDRAARPGRARPVGSGQQAR